MDQQHLQTTKNVKNSEKHCCIAAVGSAPAAKLCMTLCDSDCLPVPIDCAHTHRVTAIFNNIKHLLIFFEIEPAAPAKSDSRHAQLQRGEICHETQRC